MGYQKIDLLNSQPINQVAKKLLKKVGCSPDPSMLFLLQLAEWGLDSGKVEVQDLTNQYAGSDLLKDVRNLMYFNDPEELMEVLLREGLDPGGDPGSAWVDPKELVGLKSTEDAAVYLLDRIKAALDEKEAEALAKKRQEEAEMLTPEERNGAWD